MKTPLKIQQVKININKYKPNKTKNAHIKQNETKSPHKYQ